MSNPQIIRNAIQTPDGTILESFHRNNYATHIDRISGEEYMVDGGMDYLRRYINEVPAVELSVTTNDSFEVQREAFRWGTFGKGGKSNYKRVKLAEMSNDHILAILETQWHIRGTYVEKLMKDELQYRTEHDVFIRDTK